MRRPVSSARCWGRSRRASRCRIWWPAGSAAEGSDAWRLRPARLDRGVNILTVNLLFGTLVFWIAARVYVLPRLRELGPRAVLLPILLLHGLRYLGLMFLAEGATYPGMPPEFARQAAFGDLLAAILAVASIPAVLTGSSAARILVLAFNVEGSVDLITAIVMANVYRVDPYLGPAYWIPAVWVPALLVTHYVTFLVLWNHWNPAAWKRGVLAS